MIIIGDNSEEIWYTLFKFTLLLNKNPDYKPKKPMR
jgi:hypothetical protein